MRLIIVGPPGAGKGTQAARVAQWLDIPAISTGDIFRSNIAAGTVLGKQVQEILASGAYVPDEVTNVVVRNRLGEPDAAKGFLLDGYPRTAAQVEELDDMISGSDAGLDAVIELVAPVDELVQRLLIRAQTEGRADDTEEVIRHRQMVFLDQTAPLVAIYQERGLLREVDGTGDVDAVTERIQSALSP
jgi:adenylate kinase